MEKSVLTRWHFTVEMNFSAMYKIQILIIMTVIWHFKKHISLWSDPCHVQP